MNLGLSNKVAGKQFWKNSSQQCVPDLCNFPGHEIDLWQAMDCSCVLLEVTKCSGFGPHGDPLLPQGHSCPHGCKAATEASLQVQPVARRLGTYSQRAHKHTAIWLALRSAQRTVPLTTLMQAQTPLNTPEQHRGSVLFIFSSYLGGNALVEYVTSSLALPSNCSQSLEWGSLSPLG